MNTEHLNPEQAKAVNTINAFGADYCGGTVEQLYILVQLLNDEFFAKQKTSLLLTGRQWFQAVSSL